MLLLPAVSAASHLCFHTVLCSICSISCLFPYCPLQYLEHISVVSNILSLSPCCSLQYLQGLASWLPPEAGMFMWMKLEGGVKDADDIIDALKDEQVAVVPGQHQTH